MSTDREAVIWSRIGADESEELTWVPRDDESRARGVRVVAPPCRHCLNLRRGGQFLDHDSLATQVRGAVASPGGRLV